MQALRSQQRALQHAYSAYEHSNMLPAYVQSSCQLQTARGIKLFEIFSKEARTERRRKLKEDMQHGYFDDFRAVRDQEGKIFASPERLLDAQVSEPFPQTEMVQPNGNAVVLPPSPSHFKAALLCTAFRAGAEDMLASWSDPFKAAFGSNSTAQYYELSFVESAVMSMWPFKQIILNAQLKKGPISPRPQSAPSHSQQPASSSASTATATVQDLAHDKQQVAVQQQAVDGATAAVAEHSRQDSSAADSPGQMQTAYLFHFGDTTEIRKALSMPNRLTGYAFLIDANGLVRWRGSGKAKQNEVAVMLRAAEQLLHPKR